MSRKIFAFWQVSKQWIAACLFLAVVVIIAHSVWAGGVGTPITPPPGAIDPATGQPSNSTAEATILANAAAIQNVYTDPFNSFDSLEDLIIHFDQQQEEILPIAPPAPDFVFYSELNIIKVFAPTGFPSTILSQLIPEPLANAAYVYRLTVCEDDSTHERVFYNANAVEIGRAPPSVDYDPYFYLRKYQSWAMTATTPEAEYLRALYNPARILGEYLLMPSNYLPSYALSLAIAEYQATAATKKSLARPMAFISGLTNPEISAFRRIFTNPAQIEISLPDGYTNTLWLFSKTNMLVEGWSNLGSTNTANITNLFVWTDTTATNFGSYFYTVSTNQNFGLVPPSVSGSISYSGFQTGAIWVVASTSSNSWATNNAVLISGPGSYKIRNLTATNYYLQAWMDSNGNGSNDWTEAYGLYVNNPLVITNTVTGINITLTDPDTDANGLPDWWEMLYFGSTGQIPSADPDGDGYSNLQEYQAQSDPTNALSHPWDISGTVSYSGPQTGTIYVIASAAAGNWMAIGSTTVTNNGTYTITHLPPCDNYYIQAYQDSTGGGSNLFWFTQGASTNNPVYLTTNLFNINVTLTDPDTDGDGIPDWWEVLYGLDPFNPVTPDGAWWRLDETGGTTAQDSTGNGNTGSLSTLSTNAFTIGVISNALSFNGAGYVQVSDSQSLEPEVVSVELWVNPAQTLTTNSSAVFFSKQLTGGTTGYQLSYKQGSLSFVICSSGANTLNYPCTLTSGAWHHVAGTYGCVNQRLYLDGILRTNITYNWNGGFGYIDQGGVAPRLGASPDATPTNLFSGTMDDVRIYDHEIASNEVYGAWQVGADPDNDGLSNWQEFFAGTNPYNAYTDGDGIPDGWKVAHGLNPLDPSVAMMDVQGDGFPLVYKYKHGIDPFYSNAEPTYQAGGMDVLVTNYTFEAIQAAINSTTQDYAIVWLTPGNQSPYWIYQHGTSSGGVLLSFNGKKVMVSGQTDSANDTWLCLSQLGVNGDGIWYSSQIQFTNKESRASVLRSVTLTSPINQSGSAPYTFNSSYLGALYCQNASPTITKCVFTACNMRQELQQDGAAFYSKGGSPAILNSTISHSGAYQISPSGYQWTAGGGGMYLEGGMPVVSNCTFSYNGACSGGSLYMNNATSLIVNCQISNNAGVSGNGGGVVMYGPGTLLNSTIQNNVSSDNVSPYNATYGGGVYAAGTSAGSPCLSGCTLANNQALYNSSSGGGLYLTGGYPVVSNCVISGNTCDSSGGGLCMNNATGLIVNSYVSGNTGNGNGGGLYFAGCSNTLLSMVIANNTNTSGNGGGVYADSASSLSLQISIIMSNSANYGGGIYAKKGGFLSALQVFANTASGGGGGIDLEGGLLLLNNSWVGNNQATSTGNGGGIFVNGNNSQLVSSNTVLVGNIGYDGGGVYAANPATLVFANGVFQSNLATYNGGVAYGNGSGCTTLVTSCQFTGNIATNDGAVAWWQSGVCSIINGYASGNTAKSAFYFKQTATTLVQNCTLVGNFNTNSGTATVYNYNNTNLLLRNTVLWGNTTAQLGVYSTNGQYATKAIACCIQGGYTNAAASGIVTGNPDLTGGYRMLFPWSSCITNGVSTGCPTNDLDGLPRNTTTPDIGCGSFNGTLDPANNFTLSWEQYYFGTTNIDPNADFDGDGLNNAQEYQNMTPPLSATDTDGDGLPDDWCSAHGLPINNPANATGSWNNSGVSNLQQFQGKMLAVRVAIYDPDLNDDSWSLLYNGNVVATCNPANGFYDSRLVYVPIKTTAFFTIQHLGSLIPGMDEYVVELDNASNAGTPISWVALPGNSPSSGCVIYPIGSEPDMSGVHWSFYVPENQLPSQTNPDGDKACTHEPINTIDGSVTLDETDLVLPCPSSDLSLSRSYNNNQPASPIAALGPGWSHEWAWSLTSVTNTAYADIAGNFAIMHTGDGQDYWFPQNADGSWSSPQNSPLSLAAYNGNYRVTFPAGNTADFSTNGLLLRLADAFNVGISCTTNGNGLLSQLTHDNGRSLAFSYNGNNLLTNVFAATNLYLVFGYDASNRLSTVTRVAASQTNITKYAYENICNCLTQRINAISNVFVYGVQVYTNAPANTNCIPQIPAQMVARGTNMTLNGTYYGHSLNYTNPGGFATRVTYYRGDTNTVLDYHYDNTYMRIQSINGPCLPSQINTAIWSNTFTRFYYDGASNPTNTMIQDGASGNSLATIAFFDSNHNPVSSGVSYNGNSVGGWWQKTWNADNTLASSTDPVGHVTTFGYNNGLVSLIRACTDPVNNIGYDTQFYYSSAASNQIGGLLLGVTNANGNGVANAYDSNGYLAHVIPALGPDVLYYRNSLGYVTNSVTPSATGSRTNAFIVDPLGRISSATRPDGRSESFKYDLMGNLTNSIDFAGRTNVLTWLPVGHLQASTRWLGPTSVIYSNYYDRQFNSLKITDPLGRIVESYVLDGQDRPLTVTNLEQQTMTFNYGVGRQVLSVKRFDGTIVSNSFDSAGRIAAVKYPGLTNSFTYYDDGSLATAANTAGTVANTFDILNRLSSTMGADSTTVGYGYYPAGQVSNVVSVAGTNTYTLDAADRLASITTSTGTFTFAYNTWNGYVAAVTNQNGALSVSFGYDLLDRVTNIVWRNSTGGVVRSFGYRYDVIGNITNIIRDASNYSRNFTYDSLDRLISETTNGASPILTVYDNAGNRTSRGGANYLYIYTNSGALKTDRLAWFVNGTNLFDAAGEVKQITYSQPFYYYTTFNLVWNSARQLSNIWIGAYSESYGYDALGRRAWTQTSLVYGGGATGAKVYHVYAGQNVVADLDSAHTNAMLRSYTWGPGVDALLSMTVYTGAVAQTYYAIRDHQNTVWALTDTNGVVVESYDYDTWGFLNSVKDKNGNLITTPNFGFPASALGNRYMFQGREYSAFSGLYYFRARWYSPLMGRWLSDDPIGINGGWNQYVFCDNNPVNNVDPTGLQEEEASPLEMELERERERDGENVFGREAERSEETERERPSWYDPADPRPQIGPATYRNARKPCDVAAGNSRTALARQLGQAGENAVGITGPKTAIEIPGSGKIRIPDELTDTTLTEVKNVKSQSFTQQLRDFSSYSQANNLQFELWVQPSTQLSSPLQQAIYNSQITLKYIPGAR